MRWAWTSRWRRARQRGLELRQQPRERVDLRPWDPLQQAAQLVGKSGLGGLQSALAGSRQAQLVAAPVVRIGATLDHPGLDERANELRDGGSRHAGTTREVGPRDV